MFNKSQIQAISHMDGPAMVLAGPGSGKTTVITHRIKNLIEKAEVRPENILVVTFTKAADYKYAEEIFYINEWREGTTGNIWHFS
ncbi:MAG: UvrD-helicase domain-containing protein [Eubacterium ventriosum]